MAGAKITPTQRVFSRGSVVPVGTRPLKRRSNTTRKAETYLRSGPPSCSRPWSFEPTSAARGPRRYSPAVTTPADISAHAEMTRYHSMRAMIGEYTCPLNPPPGWERSEPGPSKPMKMGCSPDRRDRRESESLPSAKPVLSPILERSEGLSSHRRGYSNETFSALLGQGRRRGSAGGGRAKSVSDAVHGGYPLWVSSVVPKLAAEPLDVFF